MAFYGRFCWALYNINVRIHYLSYFKIFFNKVQHELVNQ